MYDAFIVFTLGVTLAALWFLLQRKRLSGKFFKSDRDGVPESTELSNDLKELIELNKTRSSAWWGFLQNLGFFLAGAIVSVYSPEIKEVLDNLFLNYTPSPSESEFEGLTLGR